MKLKKLLPQLVTNIIDAGFDTEPKEVQTLSMPKIKSGSDLFIVAPEGSGKTTALVMGIIQQLKAPFEEAPRAIIMAHTKKKVYEIEELFATLSKRTKLRSVVVFDKGILQYQKDMVYEGVDVVIGTPKRIKQLLNVMGIPMIKLSILAVDNAELFFSNSQQPTIYRVADGMPKIQIIVTADKWNNNLSKLSDRIMKNPSTVKVE